MNRHAILAGTLMGRVLCRTFVQPFAPAPEFPPATAAAAGTTSPRSLPRVSLGKLSSVEKVSSRLGCFAALPSHAAPPRPAAPEQPPMSRLHVVAGYGDDAIRAIYATKECIVGVMGNAVLKLWQLENSANQSTAKIDRRLSSSVKFVLQHNSQILIPSQGITVALDLQEDKTVVFSFRLSDKDLVPCGYNGSELLLYTHYSGQPRNIRVLSLPESGRAAQAATCRWTTVFGDASIAVTAASFWGVDKVVIAGSRGTVLVHQWTDSSAGAAGAAAAAAPLTLALPFAKDFVVAFGGADPAILIALTRRQTLLLWRPDGSLCYAAQLQGVTFDSPVAPLIRSCGAAIAFSGDQGVFLLDLSPPGAPAPVDSK